MRWRSTTTGSILRRLLVSGLIGALALTTAGCWNPFAPPRGDTPQIEVSYKLRTSPENVLYNLNTAYVYKNRGEYLDCLAEEFLFHPNPDDVTNAEDPLPESWGKQEESDIHRDMFAQVDRITLTMTFQDSLRDMGANPSDPADDKLNYWEGIDLKVTPDLTTFYANAPQQFIFRIDPLEVGPEGETLWEVIDWWDLKVDGGRLRDLPTVEYVTFGRLKALYR